MDLIVTELYTTPSVAPIRQPIPAGQFRAVIYRAGEFEFATDVAQVQEIVRPGRMMRTGILPSYVEGVIKRRGHLVPVVYLRKRLRFTIGPQTPETCVIIIKLTVGLVGFLVDSAMELRRIQPEALETPSALLARIDQIYIQAIAQSGNRLLVMLDLQRLLTEQEQNELAMIKHD
jgi:purine-binding chemotaxis protein CheW